MSDFEVKVVRISEVLQHPNADKLDIVKIGGYNCISGKLEDGSSRYKTGDLVVYIPEGAILPEWIIDRLGLRGMLAGKDKNRVKAVKLRGVVSQGILYPAYNENNSGKWFIQTIEKNRFLVKEGDDVADDLEITKYVPRVPENMSGEVVSLSSIPVKFDIENIKKYPDVFVEGEEVEFTEKIHGTFCQIGFVPNLTHPDLFNCAESGSFFVTSKGLGAQGLVFKNNERNRNSNIYVKTLLELMKKPGFVDMILHIGLNIRILGEIYGPGVQDMQYGLKEKTFRIFDVFYDLGGDMRHCPVDETASLAVQLGLTTVPVLYRGPFSKDKVEEYTSGKTVAGNGCHIREGIVIRPVYNTLDDPQIGRRILKSVSDDYLFRKGNVTEYN